MKSDVAARITHRRAKNVQQIPRQQHPVGYVLAQRLSQLQRFHRKRMVGKIVNRAQHQIRQKRGARIIDIDRLAGNQAERGARYFPAQNVIDLLK